MSVSRFAASDFSTYFEGESYQQLSESIARGETQVVGDNVDDFFSMLGHLPSGSIRLSWHEIPHLGISENSTRGPGGLEAKIDFLASVGSYFGIGSHRGWLFEDISCDCVLELTFDHFVALGAEFFRTAGHKYLLSVNQDWLVNFTMEEQVYFSDRIADQKRTPSESDSTV